jgi:hypothetical protein
VEPMTSLNINIICLPYGGHFSSTVFFHSSIRQNIHWRVLLLWKWKLLDAGRLVLFEGQAVLVLAVLLFSHSLHTLRSYGKWKFSCRKEENAFTKPFAGERTFFPFKRHGVDKDDEQEMQ